ncbi:Imm32 family immunity protein [Kitasatospora sp. NPDC003701]
MQLHYSDHGGEAALFGGPDELIALAAVIRAGAGTVALDPVADAAPYDRGLAVLEVGTAAGAAVTLSVEGPSDRYRITGEPRLLDVLAANVEEYARYADPDDSLDHLHVDPFPGHYYLSPESESLVVHLSA